jgi:hypothetical protein
MVNNNCEDDIAGGRVLLTLWAVVPETSNRLAVTKM